METLINDAGLYLSAGTSEKADCVVRALALAADCDYTKAHAACAAEDRKPRGRHKWVKIEDTAARLGLKLKRIVQATDPTVGRVAEDFKTGTYLVGVNGHMFTMLNGVAHDLSPVGTRKRVKYLWRVL